MDRELPQPPPLVAVESDRDAARLWDELRAATSPAAFQRAWLALQCALLPGVRAGLLLLADDARGPFRPVAVWPHVQGDLKPLAAAAERALREKSGLVLRSERGARERCQLAQPLEIDGALLGAVALELDARPAEDLSRALRQLRAGAGALEAHALRLRRDEARALAERLQTAIELVAAAAGRAGFRDAATHFATACATRLACDRVSLGVRAEGATALVALSHSARFEKRANLVRAIEAAMDEASDQGRSLVHPPEPGDEAPLVRAHAELAASFGSAAVCSVPLKHDGRACGALTLERNERLFGAEERTLFEAVAALAAPLLELARREDRWIGAKLRDSVREGLAVLLGPERAGTKLAAAAALLAALFLLVAKGDYRVSADAVLEPALRRAAVAPFDGYVAEAYRRAGELVREGELLVRLDDRELRLEGLRWRSELAQLEKQHRRARAEGEAAEARILSASLEEARAQLALVEDRLSRARLVAPFDGLVVQGDLSQSLGAPVERGEVLLEVAPLESYRLLLEVDERDVRDVAVGQAGAMVLEAMPESSFGFEVVNVTPVSRAEEGHNTFRVEAELAEGDQRLRPGMEGVGKIAIDRRRLAWIWTHEAIDWLRLRLWSWLP